MFNSKKTPFRWAVFVKLQQFNGNKCMSYTHSCGKSFELIASFNPIHINSLVEMVISRGILAAAIAVVDVFFVSISYLYYYVKLCILIAKKKQEKKNIQYNYHTVYCPVLCEE